MTTTELKTYRGKCHCGAVSFTFESEPIRVAMRCNCSICRRRNAIMSLPYYSSGAFRLLSGSEALSVYRFPPHLVNHYFCTTCGIYPFHDAVEKPGAYRVNLGCVDEIEPQALEVRVFDGARSWEFLD